MSTLELLTKRCAKCCEEKPASEFYRNTRSKDGLRNWCKDCNREAVAAYQARERAEDPEGFRHRNRLSVQKARQKPEVRERGRRQQAAYGAATRTLIERHRDEFDALYRLEKYERGLA